jgi:hypothetical protein
MLHLRDALSARAGGGLEFALGTLPSLAILRPRKLGETSPKSSGDGLPPCGIRTDVTKWERWP